MNHTKEYKFTNPDNSSWPSKVFDFKSDEINFEKLYQDVKQGLIPNSISILENEKLENQLSEQKFQLKSGVIGMYLDLSEAQKPYNYSPDIEAVRNENQAAEFAKIASAAFGYEVKLPTVSALINDLSRLKIYLGQHNGKQVSCGMLFLDSKGYSGLHMIRTLPDHRGLGLGNIMSNKLLFEAYENSSETAVLVASEAGAKIYLKMGFVAEGILKSYY